ncbi:MAG: ATP-binding cassette domain-containing protein [Acidobacteria bacterium]|nr:ATP-binding cassette domain-containing protein [Acidobacteriota bacterium]
MAVRSASGSGKTTFLNLIAGILQADKGTIVLAGQTMTSLSESGRDRVRAKTIGYVFQNFNLLQGYTAIENVMLGMLFGSGVDRARCAAAAGTRGPLASCQLPSSQLSIGQQREWPWRVALANRPKPCWPMNPPAAWTSATRAKRSN